MCGSQTEAVKLKLTWRPQDVQDVRAMRYLLKKTTNRECNQSRRKKFDVVNEDAKGVGDLKTALKSDMESESLEFAQIVFCLALEMIG